MRIEEIKKYIADDGKEFDNERECLRYEKKCAANVKNLKGMLYKYYDTDDLFDSGCDCDGYIFLKIRSRAEQEQFTKWYNAANDVGEMCDDSCDWLVGKTIMVDCYNPNDCSIDGIECVYSFETVEQNIARYAERILTVTNGNDWMVK